MAKVLVLAEISGDTVKSVTYEILGKLTGHDVDVAAVGEVPAAAVTELAKYGAANVHSIKGLDNYSPEGYTNALKEFIGSNYDFVFGGATSLGKDLLPRLAGAFEAGLASDVTNFVMDGDNFSGTRPMFSGKCLAKVEISGPKPHFVSIRPNALGMPEAPTAGAGATNEVTGNAGNIRAAIKEIIKGASEKLDLTEANIIVSGGRAMKSAENFKILEELADVLGATVGASRAAVDSGYAAPSMQVGQTGKTVAPTLYIACGISGAIQHLAGMRTSKVIVAINTDADAPIFTKADYGIVGDLFQIVPILKDELKKVLG
ncbi:electron transfer flavoprotein subunit alpha/FixB family protein [Halobacteriovorax sp. GB3]|uniref:electron transfer flavoprotein subunit alpha/FixB family protein n=1 Tax=Halobacteriovorax sp. GB3 TaxID=2719615 RepID=UPI00235EACE8|nr:electron transfer flavoprotein subunit alpha/FixB family protein [Halobacteriovorax sp. GB3]MDD0854780.1 electron transfer flavoprotein subunit alpha/FixB family protein [Halobacteriovorax sp. GB3]